MAGREAEDLNQDYAQAGFGGQLGMGAKPALVIVDFVMAYLDPASPLFAEAEAERATAERLLEAARAAAIPIVFTRVEYQPGGGDGGYFYKKVKALSVFDRGSPFGAYAPGLEPRADETVITKQYPSAFFGTPLASILHTQGVDSCIIAGMSTSGCVRASALDALQYGFIPIVVADACGDRDQKVQDANLFDLGAKYADVVDADSVIKYLTERA